MARDFDGTNDFLSLAANSDFENFSAFTLSAWVYRTGDPGNDGGRVINKADGATSDDWHLAITSSNRVTARVKTSAGTTTITGSTTITLNTWRHLMAVWDGTNLTCYIDGTEENSGTNSGTINDANGSLGVGGHTGSSTRRVQGRIAEAAVWNTNMNSSRRAQLVAGVSALHLIPGNLRGYWPLYGNTDPEQDFSGKGHSLILNSAPPQADHSPTQPLMFGTDELFPPASGAPAPAITRQRLVGMLGVGFLGLVIRKNRNKNEKLSRRGFFKSIIGR